MATHARWSYSYVTYLIFLSIMMHGLGIMCSMVLHMYMMRLLWVPLWCSVSRKGLMRHMVPELETPMNSSETVVLSSGPNINISPD